jgi:hypothetical protein
VLDKAPGFDYDSVKSIRPSFEDDQYA